MPENLLYFSTNTKISFILNEKFYNQRHFVWCAPVFDPRKENSYDTASLLGPTSSPCEIYETLKSEVSRSDRHSVKIDQNKIGLKKGAASKLEEEVITEQEFARITYYIDNATNLDFTPLLYIIPRDKVKDRIIEVHPKDTATLFGMEYQIKDLHRSEFSIIEF